MVFKSGETHAFSILVLVCDVGPYKVLVGNVRHGGLPFQSADLSFLFLL